MLSYALRRIALLVPVLIGLSMLVFVIGRLLPGDPAGLAAGPNASKQEVAALAAEFGMDLPVPVQYLRYVKGLAQGDWGRSLLSRGPVIDDLKVFVPATLELVLAAMGLAILVGVPAGLLSAVHRNGWLDDLVRLASLASISMPRFFLGLLLQLVFAMWLGWLALGGRFPLTGSPPPVVTGMMIPDSLLAADDTRSLNWRRDFIRSYLERDVPMFAPRLPAETIGRLWTMLAHNQGSVLNQARIASALGVANPTIDRYIDLLVDLQLVRRLRPWGGNLGKRLVKSPKVYVRDSGLLHGLLELETVNDLLGHPVCGHSFVGHCIDNLIQAAGKRHVPYFYRTHVGAEIDLVLEKGGKPEIAIEVKRSMAPSPDKGFSVACDDLKITHRYLVYPGLERIPLRHGAQAIGLQALAEILAQA
jgi:ABC-type antimicrobial peptide transport system permease subunit